MTAAPPLTPAQFAGLLSGPAGPVSRETLLALDRYALMLEAWQTRVNLVGPSTLADIWRRHFLDSAQLLTLIPDPPQTRLIDIGSGAGFPGLVLALLGVGDVTLVESVGKKARFLEAVVDALGLSGRCLVHNGRVEALKTAPFDVITARACASLTQVFDWTRRFAAQGTRWLLLKGETVAQELDEAARDWRFGHRLHASLSDPRGRIVEVWDVVAVKDAGRAPRARR